jgi:hypothetical protein
MAEQHAHELGPTAKSPRIAIRLVLPNGLFKLRAWEQFEELGEDAAYSIQGW